MAREFRPSRARLGMKVVRLSAPDDDDPNADEWYEETIRYCDERLDSEDESDREKAYYIGLAARLEARRRRQERR